MKEEDSLLIPKTAAAAATSQVHILASLVGSHTPQWSPPSHQPVVSAEEAEEEGGEGGQGRLVWGELGDHSQEVHSNMEEEEEEEQLGGGGGDGAATPSPPPSRPLCFPPPQQEDYTEVEVEEEMEQLLIPETAAVATFRVHTLAPLVSNHTPHQPVVSAAEEEEEMEQLLIPETAAATFRVHILAPSEVNSGAPHQLVVSAEEEEEEEEVAEGRQDTLIWGDLRDHGGQHDFSDDDLELQIAVDWLALGNQVPLMASFAGDWAGLLIDD